MTTQDELRQEIDKLHERFFACFMGIGDTVLETQPLAGAWSPRDVAGHLADWNLEILGSVEHVLGGAAPRGHPIKDIEVYNSTQSALRGIESWQQTSADLRDSWERVTETIARLNQDDLAKIGELPWGRVEPVENFFRILADHVRDHVEEAEIWRLKMLGLRDRDL